MFLCCARFESGWSSFLVAYKMEVPMPLRIWSSAGCFSARGRDEQGRFIHHSAAGYVENSFSECRYASSNLQPFLCSARGSAWHGLRLFLIWWIALVSDGCANNTRARYTFRGRSRKSARQFFCWSYQEEFAMKCTLMLTLPVRKQICYSESRSKQTITETLCWSQCPYSLLRHSNPHASSSSLGRSPQIEILVTFLVRSCNWFLAVVHITESTLCGVRREVHFYISIACR